MNVKLTATQTAILKAAAGRPDGNIEPLPTTLHGGARAKVIEGLLARDLVARSQPAVSKNYSPSAQNTEGVTMRERPMRPRCSSPARRSPVTR